MENEEKKPTTRTRKSSSSSSATSSTGARKSTSSTTSSTRIRKTTTKSEIAGLSSTQSAEEKLKRSMKGLSHTGSGGGGIGLTTSTQITKSKNSERKKVGGVVLDMETIQGAHKQKFETKGRRNNVVILVLSLLLVVSLVYLVIAMLGYQKAKEAPNCRFEVKGDASASWLVEGSTKTHFHIAKGLLPDTIYMIDARLNIETTTEVTLTIEVDATIDGKAFLISGFKDGNDNLIRIDKTNKYEYKVNITGGGTIEIFKGIDFSNAPLNLKSSNVRIEVNAYVSKV